MAGGGEGGLWGVRGNNRKVIAMLTRRYEGYRRVKAVRPVSRKYDERYEKIVSAAQSGGAACKRRGSLIKGNPLPFLRVA